MAMNRGKRAARDRVARLEQSLRDRTRCWCLFTVEVRGDLEEDPPEAGEDFLDADGRCIRCGGVPGGHVRIIQVVLRGDAELEPDEA